jgi:hypothetical protein
VHAAERQRLHGLRGEPAKPDIAQPHRPIRVDQVAEDAIPDAEPWKGSTLSSEGRAGRGTVCRTHREGER